MTDGNFQVEGYCDILNSEYDVDRDDTDWYCTFRDQRALTLRESQFTDICQRTYNEPNAVAIQVQGSAVPALQWRCYVLTALPTATPIRQPALLNGGRGLTDGSVMNNGNFQVEAYCRTINPNYNVTEDRNFWYCTENDQRVLTLGVAEFDDICIRTYSNPAAFSQQIQNSEPPAYRWRCYAYQD